MSIIPFFNKRKQNNNFRYKKNNKTTELKEAKLIRQLIVKYNDELKDNLKKKYYFIKTIEKELKEKNRNNSQLLKIYFIRYQILTDLFNKTDSLLRIIINLTYYFEKLIKENRVDLSASKILIIQMNNLNKIIKSFEKRITIKDHEIKKLLVYLKDINKYLNDLLNLYYLTNKIN